MGKNMLKLDVKGFDEYIAKLEKLDSDVKKIVTDALNQAGETITNDTMNALSPEFLPAGGQYSTNPSMTNASVVKNPRTQWSGTIAEIGVGFDFTKPGAGGYLISGTPKMAPDRELNRIYKNRRYMNEIKKYMIEIFNDEIKKRMGG